MATPKDAAYKVEQRSLKARASALGEHSETRITKLRDKSASARQLKRARMAPLRALRDAEAA